MLGYMFIVMQLPMLTRGWGGVALVFHPMILILGVNNFNHDFSISDLFAVSYEVCPIGNFQD